MWKLVIEDDEGKRTVVPLSRETYSIGRKDGNTIRLTERNVSREHARISRRTKADAPAEAYGGVMPSFVLEDLTSYNGVFVNGLRITHSQDLSHGDLVQIGDYRIVLQDETTTAAIAAAEFDPKQTVPQAPNSRAAALLDRPNRLVMLVGPTPGVEFPLDKEKLSVGRAEDADISVNHNSVSRLHCEIHSLGDGRFEIVDQGSSNGVRVNGADLRRGIVEPGDVLELGDVKFRFIGAGQIFRPTESQKLALLGDRAAADLISKRGTTALPVAIFAVVVAAGAVGAWIYTRPKPEIPAALVTATVSPDQVTLEDAQRRCASGDCEGAHDELAALPASSPVRSTQELRDVVGRWADQQIAKADAEGDAARKHALYQHVAQDMMVDSTRRSGAANKLQALDAVASQLTASAVPVPSVSSRPVSDEPKPEPTRHAMAPEPAAPTPPPTTASPPASTPTPSTPPPAAPPSATASAPVRAPGSVDDKERSAALQANTLDAKMAVKQQLEQRVYSGKASDTEIRLLISTCKELGDKMCVSQARQIQAQKAAPQ